MEASWPPARSPTRRWAGASGSYASTASAGLLDKVFSAGARSRPTDIHRAGDGVLVAGWTQAAEDRGQAAARWLRLINAKGGIEWEEPILGEGAERIWRVLPLEYGGYLLLPSRFRPEGRPHLVRVDHPGKVKWEKQLASLGVLRDAVILPQGGVLAVRVSGDPASQGHAWAIRLGYRD